MFEQRPFERDRRIADERIDKAVKSLADLVPAEIVIGSLLENAFRSIKSLEKCDQRQMLGLILNEFCEKLESVSWIVYINPDHYLDIMHRYDRQNDPFRTLPRRGGSAPVLVSAEGAD